MVNDAAAEAIQFQIDLMRGWITDPDGNRIPVTDIYQRPMAAKTLLKWTIELQALLQNVQQEQTNGEIKITEIQINRPGANGQKNILTDFNRLFSPCTMTDHKPFYQRNPDGTLQINFHTGQERAWDSTARFVCVLSDTQGGKTSFGPPWLQREIKTRGPGDYL